MSATLTLSHGAKTEYTMISNAFIDRYMPQANGTYVKVYLYFVRLLGDPSYTGTLSSVADLLDETEKDIERALKYWEKEGLVSLTRNGAKEITDIAFLPVPGGKPDGTDAADAENTFGIAANASGIATNAPDAANVSGTAANVFGIAANASGTAANTSDIAVNASGIAVNSSGTATDISAAKTPKTPAQNRFEKPDYSEAQITALTSLDEVKWLISRLEQTLGRLLKPADLQTLLFLYESIGFAAELIVYLYEYCASKNKKSPSYIEAVGIAWAQSGVDTIEKAEAETTVYSQNYSIVNRAFGLNRSPGGIEMKYIHRWSETFGFDASIIEEACNRTMLATSKPDFKYADKILTRWHEAGIRKKTDIAVLDSEFARKNAAAKAKEDAPRTAPPPPNRFGAFPQRKYTASDYSELEGMLLRKDTTHAN